MGLKMKKETKNKKQKFEKNVYFMIFSVWLSIFGIMCFIGIMTITIANMNFILKEGIVGYDRVEMLGIKPTLNTLLLGIYKQPGYYCVWTKGRDAWSIIDSDPSLQTLKQVYVDSETKTINSTAFHELVHALIDKDYNHFCSKGSDIISNNECEKDLYLCKRNVQLYKTFIDDGSEFEDDCERYLYLCTG
jgi:hypothetical protein